MSARCAVAFALAAAAMPLRATADAWYASPEVGAASEFRSNPDFARDARSGTLAALDATFPIAWTDERTLATLAPRVRLAETGGTSRASPNAYAFLGALTRTDERGSFGLRGGYADESTLDGARDVADAFRIDGRRRRLDAAVDASRALSERLELQAAAGWQRTYFGGATDAALTDYRTLDATLGVAYGISERLALTASGSAMRYRADTTDVRQQTISLQAGLRWSSDAGTTWRGEYGRSRARTAGASSESGVVYLAAVERRWPRATLAATAEQQVAPSGFGAITRARALDLRWNFRLTERLAVDASASEARNTDLFSTPLGEFGLRRRLRTATTGLSWEATPSWSIGGSLGWQSQALGPAADWRNGVVVAVTTRRTFGRVRLD